MDFIGGWEQVWDDIRKNIDERRRIIAAIAYFSKPDSLPWKRGDIVIANFSKHTLSTGASNPFIALDLLRDVGVEFRSRGDLHAKVIWDGTRAFVGSMNSSAHAHGDLLEAMVTVDESLKVSKIGRWLHNLRSESDVLTVEALQELTKFYKPPRGGSGGGKRRKPKALNTGINAQGRTWLCSSVYDDRAEPKEVKEIREQGPEQERFVGYTTYVYAYRPTKDAKPIEEGDHIIFYNTIGRQTDVWPPAEVWKKKLIEEELRLFIAVPRSDARRTEPWSDFKKRARRCGFAKLTSMNEYLVARGVAEAIQESWPEPHPRRRKRRSR
jgi:hypothetical protein